MKLLSLRLGRALTAVVLACGILAAATVAEGLYGSLSRRAAIDRPRFHPAGRLVNAEPGVDESALAELENRGLTVKRWSGKHHYFGGVSLVARAGPAADSRRSGAAATI